MGEGTVTENVTDPRCVHVVRVFRRLAGRILHRGWEGRRRNWVGRVERMTMLLLQLLLHLCLRHNSLTTNEMCSMPRYLRLTWGAAAAVACRSNCFTASFAAFRFAAGSHVFSHSGYPFHSTKYSTVVFLPTLLLLFFTTFSTSHFCSPS